MTTPAAPAAIATAPARARARYPRVAVNTVGPGTITAAVTVDVHDYDDPGQIVRGGRWLAAAGVRASCFVPSAMLLDPAQRAAILELRAMGHELGSHSHLHDAAEMQALMAGRDLGFLERSRDLHAETFGARPWIFRSPRWCPLAPAAVAELARLGYHADSSATPQRLPWLSSLTTHWEWWGVSRSVREIAPGLVEVPTSCALVPAGSPTFRTFRGLSALFLALLETEARLLAGRAVVIQLHLDDVLPDADHLAPPWRPAWRDLNPFSGEGFGFKALLRERDPRRAAAIHQRLVGRLRRLRLATIGEIASEHVELSQVAP